MKRSLRTVLFVLCGFYVTGATAQSMDELTEPPLMHYTPTPQTWGFVRYGNTPVDHYTGTAQASIPLYEYSDPDFSFSISAGYASGGFMPQRQTGILGMNWFLNCGGVITREIRGIDDFSRDLTNSPTAGFMVGGESATASSSASYSDSDLFDLQIGRWIGNYYVCNSSSQNYPLQHSFEVASDIYHFNFMGHSGTFHFDGQRRLKVYNTHGNHGTYKIDITHSENNSSRSTITVRTGDGYVYVFGGEEKALERSIEGNFQEHSFQYIIQNDNNRNHPIVSWFLVSATAPNGRSVTFDYQTTKITRRDYINEGTNDPHYVTSFSTGHNTYIEWDRWGEISRQVPHFRRASVVRTSYLEKIRISNSIDINLTYSRKDSRDVNQSLLPGNGNGAAERSHEIVQRLNQLDAIRVSLGEQTLHTYSFAYRTTGDRLILDAVDISGTGMYRLSYYEPGSRGYPGVTTPDVDFWGFYNGKGNAYTAINPMKMEGWNDKGHSNETIFHAWKNPDFNFSIIGCLKRMEYPTGGFTDFEYEANTARSIVLKRDEAVEEEERRPGPIEEGSQPTATKYLARLNSYSSLFGASDQTGGVRIRKITDNDGMSGYQTRQYEYLENSWLSSGYVMYFPRFNTYSRNGYNVVNPLFQYPANTFDKSHIGYSTVREILADGSSVKYEFSNYKTHPDDYSGQKRKLMPGVTEDNKNDISPDSAFLNNIMREPNSQHYKRGKLHRKTLFDAQGKTVRLERMTYADADNDFSTYVIGSNRYYYSVKKPTTDYRLTSHEVVDYFDRDSICTTTDYTYNNLGQLKQSARKLWAEERFENTKITYLHETDHSLDTNILPTNYISEMTESHSRIAYNQPTQLTSVTKCTYARYGSMIKPAVVSQLDTEGRTTIPWYAIPDLEPLQFIDKVQYLAYDTKGNPVHIRDAAGVDYSFIWGYNGLYVVARIVGVSNAQVKSVPGLSGNAPLTGALTSTQETALRAIDGAHVDTYVYRPHVGMTAHTDPAGRTYSFEYDIYGRLEFTSDPMGQVQQYEYHL